MTAIDQYGSVRYLVDDVQAATDFYANHLGFEVTMNMPPAMTWPASPVATKYLTGGCTSMRRPRRPSGRA